MNLLLQLEKFAAPYLQIYEKIMDEQGVEGNRQG
jgi:hypothetical protein